MKIVLEKVAIATTKTKIENIYFFFFLFFLSSTLVHAKLFYQDFHIIAWRIKMTKRAMKWNRSPLER